MIGRRWREKKESNIASQKVHTWTAYVGLVTISRTHDQRPRKTIELAIEGEERNRKFTKTQRSLIDDTERDKYRNTNRERSQFFILRPTKSYSMYNWTVSNSKRARICIYVSDYVRVLDS